jgi:hypothetical protein
MGEDAIRVRIAHVMKEAVHQNEVERLIAHLVPCHISHLEAHAVPRASLLDVPSVDVEAEVVDPLEVGGVRTRAASDIQNPADPGQVVVSLQRLELPLREWRLPKAIDPRNLEERGPGLHGALHRT